MRKVNTIVFDMDDTLTQTSEYIRRLLFIRWKKEGRDDLLRRYQTHVAVEGQISITDKEIRQHIYEILGDPTYMLNVEPTRLFNLLFKAKQEDLLIRHRNLVVTTHRGFHSVGKAYTEQWLKDNGVGDRISTVHCLDSKTHPDKVAFLKDHYGDDFVLIDDNPLHDLTQTYPVNKHLIIYSEYGYYPAYREQNFLIL